MNKFLVLLAAVLVTAGCTAKEEATEEVAVESAVATPDVAVEETVTEPVVADPEPVEETVEAAVEETK